MTEMAIDNIKWSPDPTSGSGIAGIAIVVIAIP